MEVIVKAIAGSHLFGTNSESSDMDYKGIYLPSAKAIVLGQGDSTLNSSTGDKNTKNSKDDVDTEMYSLMKFGKMLKNGDTAAIELLFTPDEMIIESSLVWDEIKRHRSFLISENISAMVGYSRHQANKYGIKGSRMGELNNIIKELKDITKDDAGLKLKHYWDNLSTLDENFKYFNIIELPVKKGSEETVNAIDVLGKKFNEHTPVSVMLKSLSDTYRQYGQRAREAKNNNGVDFKALSHALRVCYQAQELLETGKITLPQADETKLQLIKDVKFGNIHYEKVAKILEQELETLEDLKKLPNKLNPSVMVDNSIDNLIYTIQANHIIGSIL
jgi:predicted nucleotidyltransferase